MLVELDGEEARADLAVAEAALSESRSQFKRSRELYSTRGAVGAQLEQIEATLKANDARVASARARLDDTVIAHRSPGASDCGASASAASISPGTVITTLDDTSTIKLDFTVPESFLPTLHPGLAIQARSVAYPGRTFAGKVGERRFARRPEHALGHRSRAAAERRGAAEARHVPDRAAVARRERTRSSCPKRRSCPSGATCSSTSSRTQRREAQVSRSAQRRVGDVEVIAGLTAGEQVVTEGTQKLRDGAPVTVPEAAPAQASSARAGERS